MPPGCAPAPPSAGRLHAAGGDAELSEQFRLIEVKVEAGDLAFLEFVDAGEAYFRRLAGRGDLAGRAAQGTGVRADAAALVHAAAIVRVDGDGLQPVVREGLVPHVPG